MTKTAVFPGSFDPITLGHTSIIDRCNDLFDSIIVAVGTNTSKKYLFAEDQRISMAKKAFASYQKVKVIQYDGLTVDFCKEHNANFIVRGLRNTIDFEYEKAIADMNAALNKTIETLFLVTEPRFSTISSSIVREILRNKGNVDQFLPKGIL